MAWHRTQASTQKAQWVTALTMAQSHIHERNEHKTGVKTPQWKCGRYVSIHKLISVAMARNPSVARDPWTDTTTVHDGNYTICQISDTQLQNVNVVRKSFHCLVKCLTFITECLTFLTCVKKKIGYKPNIQFSITYWLALTTLWQDYKFGVTRRDAQITGATSPIRLKLYTTALNICGYSVWNLLQITHLAHEILWILLHFGGKICVPLVKHTIYFCSIFMFTSGKTISPPRILWLVSYFMISYLMLSVVTYLKIILLYF
jgi:hypothetical protein